MVKHPLLLFQRLVRLLCVWACWIGLSAQAQDHITQRAWQEDPSGLLTLSELPATQWASFQGPLNLGYGKGVIWLRLKVSPHVDPVPVLEPERLVLRIRPVYLDHIEVFDPLSPAGTPILTGDLQHPRHDTLQGLDFLLRIPRGQAPRDIWLRLSTTSTRQIDVQALSVDDLSQATHFEALLYALYIGLIAVLAVWGLVHGLISREAVIGSFGLKQLAALFYALASLGYLRVLWPLDWSPSLVDKFTSVFSVLGVSAAILFHVVLQGEFGLPTWVRRMQMALLALQPIKLLMLGWGWTIETLQLNMLEVLLVPLFFFISVILARGWSDNVETPPSLPRWAAIGFYALMVTAMLWAALPGLGITNGGEVALYVVQTHGLITAFLVLLILQYRSHVMHRRQRQTALALDRSLLLAQQEREVRQEQENLLAMLAHELKTPLATMHMRLDATSSGSRQIKQAIRDMNSVIERCLEAAKLGDRQLHPHLELIDLTATLREAVSACRLPDQVKLRCPQKVMVRTDPQLIFLVLNNLLENACKYAAPNTPISIDCQLAIDSLGPLTVSFTNVPGPAGWPAADKVFQKYYRSPHARRQAGTGLGLFLVNHLMQAIGGDIAYRPTNTHVQFVLSLPSTDA